MLDRRNAPGQPLELPVAERRGEAAVGASGRSTPVGDEGLMERVVERGQLRAARRRVQRKGGRPGMEGMTVEALSGDLREHGPRSRAARVAGPYRPPPLRRVAIPKSGGGGRQLGIPTVLDRFIPQALRQVLQPKWEGTFSASS